MYIRFIVQTDHKSRTRCSGIFAIYGEVREAGVLHEHDQAHGDRILEKLNKEFLVPPFI